MKHLFTAGFLVIFFATIFQVVSSKPASSQSNYFRVKSHLQFNKKFSGNSFVLDGDSLKVGGKEVRLFGLDAPEYNQTCFDEKNEEYPCGQVSRDFLISLAGGKEVKCTYAEKDKYDRFLSKCFVGKFSINEEIIKNGMGVIYNFTESDKKMDELETSAKEQKLGIWRGAFQLPKDYRKSHPRDKK
jgi:endonuclease YncB( thermonuclease family)